MIRAVALAAALLAGCVAPIGVPLSEEDQAVVDRVWTAWAEEPDLPPVGQTCHEERPAVRTLVTDDPVEFQHLTGYCAPGVEGLCGWGDARAVFRRYTCGFWIAAAGSDGAPLFVFWEDKRALAHEIGHWTAECTTGDPDWSHDNPAIWRAAR